MINNTKAIISWLLLITLTLISIYLSKIINSNTLLLVLVFLIVFIKGQQITDVFMELKHAPTKWRMVLLSYVVVIPSIICAIYFI